MIYIHKGDDTDFNDNSFLTFNIVTEKDLTGWQAKFILNGLEKTFDDITSKSFELHYSDEETSQFKLGKTANELKLIDEEGKIKTIAKNIDISVTNEVIENESQLINLPILQDEGIDINISLVGNSGGSGGTTNHNELLNRDLANQHPISAIINLQEILDNKANKDEIPSVDGFITNDELENKQDALISGTNIKTINNESILGSGNIEIKANENDYMPLGASFYFANIQLSPKWLKSSNQWNNGNDYITFYNWLVEEKTNNTERTDIKYTSEEYGEFDYVINQDEMTFRLPLLNGSENLPSENNIDLALEASGTKYTAPANGWIFFAKNSTTAGQYMAIKNNNSLVETAFNCTASGQTLKTNLEVNRGDDYTVSYNLAGTSQMFKFVYAKGNGDLYYYVG